MRNHMLKLSRMNSINESVIICDQTPDQKSTSKLVNKRHKLTTCKNNTDSKQETPLRKSLRTLRRNLNNNAGPDYNGNCHRVVNVAAKRFREDSDTAVEQSRKRKKKNTVDESIIILSDDESISSRVKTKSSDVILIHEKKLQKAGSDQKPKRKKTKCNQSNRGVISKFPDFNNQNDDEDIAVIWSSTDENEINGKTRNDNSKNSPCEMYFIDTTGDLSNFEKKNLFRPNRLKSKQLKPSPVSNKPLSKQSTKKTIIEHEKKENGKLREIIVDGCNVARGYSHQGHFSKMGLQLVLDYFLSRGHQVKIFLPQNHRKKKNQFLEHWYRQGFVVFTPSRNINGKHIVSYDDRFIVEYATKCKGIVVSSDQFRDLWEENPEWRETIEQRLLVPTFVGNYVMFPEDPLGREGPKLEEFLRY